MKRQGSVWRIILTVTGEFGAVQNEAFNLRDFVTHGDACKFESLQLEADSSDKATGQGEAT